MRMMASLAFALLLMACDGGTTKSGLLDDTQERVIAMAPADRAPLLLRAIHDSHRRCERITRQQSIEPPGAIPTYLAECENGDRFNVFMRRDGKMEAQITTSNGGAT